MSDAHESHLLLLTDLVSPEPVPDGLLPSLAHHISTLDNAGLVHLFTVAATSIGLWLSSSPLSSGSLTASPRQALTLKHCRDIYYAVAYGVAARAERAAAGYGKGWLGRRYFSQSLKAVWAALTSSQLLQTSAHPLAVVTIGSGIFKGLQDVGATKDALLKEGDPSLWEAQKNVIILWERTALLYGDQINERDSLNTSETSVAAAWLVGQSLGGVPSSNLRLLVSEVSLSNYFWRIALTAVQPFLQMAFGYIRKCFASGRLFDDLDFGMSENEEGLRWKEESKSFGLLVALKSSAAHQQLGRFSQVLGKVIESVSTDATFHLVRPHLETLEDLAYNVNEGWKHCRWSNLHAAEELHPSTRERDEPWAILKTMLFTLTMLYSSLIALLNSVPLSPGQKPSKLVLSLAACSLRTFSYLYFVSSKFGTEGFGAYRSVWYGALDLIARGEPEMVQQIVESLEWRHTTTMAVGEPVGRSVVTYFLNAVEQLVVILPDAYLESSVLPQARPYLESRQYQDTFESAHSVLLAIFSRRKKIAEELAPWYGELLVESYPSLMSIPQLRLAYTTIVSCSSEADDGLAWYLLTKLFDAISAIPSTNIPAVQQHAEERTSELFSITRELLAEDQSKNKASKVPGRGVDNLINDKPSTRLDEAEPADDHLLSAALKTPRGHLLIVLIDQITAVNSTLLIPLLDRIAWFIGEEKSASDDCKRALVQLLFQSIATGMDMTKREQAAKWWLQKRSDFADVVKAVDLE